MATFHYRRELKPEDWVTIAEVGVGAGIGVALVVMYFTRIFLQKTPTR